LALNGTPSTGNVTVTNGKVVPGTGGTNPYDPSGTFSCSSDKQFSVDRLPLEATVGWDATLNGNLAEQLQEPSLMGAYEGAAITVLAKGVKFPAGSAPFGSDVFPVGTTLLGQRNCTTTSRGVTTNPFPSNFQCNPSSIDGLGITNSSQGGGGVFVHAWAHNLQIANNRVYNNSGTLAGGIAVGQGEFPGQYLGGNPATPNADPGSCQNGSSNTQLPYCFNLNVNVHNNMVALNSSLGDELFSSTPSGSGGVVFCTGDDYYKFQYNWVCGNLSSGDGGGMSHLGFSWNADIEHNWFLFNQSQNPTVPTNGGGLAILGAPDTDPVCGVEPDADCPSGTSDGTGPGLVINANLFLGNSAESGSGGGIRMHGVNGTELTFFPSQPNKWYSPSVTNNIIVNNVAGWDGAGISLQDAVAVDLINNTIMSNDSTASAGILFNTLGAPLSSSPGSSCANAAGTASCPQPAGVVSTTHSPTLSLNLSGLPLVNGHHLACPNSRPNCDLFSNPRLYNDVIWQNRTFQIGVLPGGPNPTYQQNLVTLFNSAFTGTTTGIAAPSQTATGACTVASYWDIGVRGDTGPANHGSGFTLAPLYSFLYDAGDYPGATGPSHNNGADPAVVAQYCNGSRVPPESYCTNPAGKKVPCGWQVPPGIADATVPNPPFTLAPAATVDEGNNWVNVSWGPLALVHPVTGATLGNYVPASGGSPTVNWVPAMLPGGDPNPAYNQAPNTDYFGNLRKTNNAVDAGAVEFLGNAVAVVTVTPTSLVFPNTTTGTTSAALTLTVSNTGGAPFTGMNVAFAPTTGPFSRPNGNAGGTCGATLNPGTCTINVVFTPTAAGAANGTVAITGSVVVTNSPVALSGTGVAPVLPMVTLTPAGGHAYGNVAVGLSTANAPTFDFTLTNAGPVGTFNAGFGGIAVTPVPFSLTGAGTFPAAAPNCGGPLAAGTSCTIRVRFRPQATGAFTGTLTVTGTSGGNAVTVGNSPAALTGTGITSVGFAGPVPALTTTDPLQVLAVKTGTITVTNLLATNLTIGNVTGNGPGASVRVTGNSTSGTFSKTTGTSALDTCTNKTLASGATCQVNVTFTPTVLQLLSPTSTGTLTITDTGGLTATQAFTFPGN